MVEHDPDAKHDERGGAEAIDRDRTEHEPNPAKRGTWLSAAIALLGVLMLLQAAVLDLAASQFWNDVLVGAGLLAVGAYNYYRRSKAEFGSAGLATFAAVLGLWLVVTPFLLGPEGTPLSATSDFGAVSDVVVGVLAFGLGGYSAVKIRDRRRDADARATATYDRRGH